MLIVNDQIKIPLWEFDFTFARSSGPGGQNVNKVNSKAVLRWRVMTSPSINDEVRARFVVRFGTKINEEGCVVLSSDRFRDQGRNVADCLDKLREMVVHAAHRPKKRKKTKPHKGAREKRLQKKSRHGEKKRFRGRVDY